MYRGREKVYEDWIIKGLEKGTLISGCDGSYKPKLSKYGISAAFKIQGVEESEYIKGTCCISGTSADSYRGELLAIYALLTTLKYIEDHNRTYSKGSISIYCDSLEVVKISNKNNTVVKMKKKHNDLIRAIRKIKSTLTTKVCFKHVYGHQDRNNFIWQLSNEARSNIEVDHEAQNAFDHAHENGSFIPNAIFFHEGWCISIGGVKLQDSMYQYINNWAGKHRLRQYLFSIILIARNASPEIDS